MAVEGSGDFTYLENDARTNPSVTPGFSTNAGVEIARDSRKAHLGSDVDVGMDSLHHTLGLSGYKAIPALILQNIAPIGQLIRFGGPTANLPKGFLAANGASVAVSSYPALFKAIGYTNGGVGANFNLPNVANYYIRYSWGI